MKLRHLVPIILTIATGCGTSSHHQVKSFEKNSHSMQELCDSLTSFFKSEFGVQDLSTKMIVTHSDTGKIEEGGICSYSGKDSSHTSVLGSINLHSTPTPADETVGYNLEAKGHEVKVNDSDRNFPVPSPSGTDYFALLTVKIGEWTGELELNSHDPAVFQRGAEALVDSVTALTS